MHFITWIVDDKGRFSHGVVTEDTAIIDARLTLINTHVDILDPIMANLYEFQPEKLHAWKRASRVERDPQRTKAACAVNPTLPSRELLKQKLDELSAAMTTEDHFAKSPFFLITAHGSLGTSSILALQAIAR